MKPIDFLIGLILFLAVVVLCHAAPRPKHLELHVHTWAGMQAHRGGALDTGPAVGVSYGRLHAGGLVAQNRAGGYVGLRNLWLTAVEDTRSGKWEIGPAVAIGF